VFLVPKNGAVIAQVGLFGASGKGKSLPLTLDQEAYRRPWNHDQAKGCAPLPGPTRTNGIAHWIATQGVISPAPENPETRTRGGFPLPTWTEPQGPPFAGGARPRHAALDAR